ncbi:MAG: hypothetical protein PHY28_09775 [Dehalococcoidales bacterium]|nr:hypothetical protein [Dehalococcoidales bacterium]
MQGLVLILIAQAYVPILMALVTETNYNIDTRMASKMPKAVNSNTGIIFARSINYRCLSGSVIYSNIRRIQIGQIWMRLTIFS